MNWGRIALTAQALALQVWGAQAAAAGLVLSRDAASTTLYAEIPR